MQKPKQLTVKLSGTNIIEIFWFKMAEIYGHKWVSQYGTYPSKSWIDGLSDVLPSQIEEGLELLLDRDDGWPPNLPEFKQLYIPKIEYFDWWEVQIRIEAGRILKESNFVRSFDKISKSLMEESLN
jgi:hypothetical protein